MSDADHLAPPTEPPQSTCIGCNAVFSGEPHESLCPTCRRSFPTLQADAAIPDEPFVVKDRICLRCQYDLTSLKSDRDCPECGTPIAHSLRGNLLRYSTHEYVRRLYTGVLLAEAAGIAAGITIILGLSSHLIAHHLGLREVVAMAISQSLSLGSIIFSLIGWWVLSTPDRSSLGPDPAMGARKLLRISMGFELAIALISYAVFLIFADFRSNSATLTSSAEAASEYLMLAGMCVWLFRFATSMVFLRTIALRIPDAKLYSNAKRLMWIGPLASVITCGILAIAAYIVYILMMERTRRTIKATLDRLVPPLD